MLKTIASILLATATTACIDMPDTASDSDDLSSAVDGELAQAEADLSVPQPSAPVAMGTFNASTNAFTGVKTITIVNPSTHKPQTMTPSVDIDAVRAVLTFQITNRGTKTVTLTVAGQSVTAPAGATSISIDVGMAPQAAWTLTVGGASVHDTVNIARDLANVGIFSIPVLPLGIVYEPPQDQAKTNVASMSSSETTITVQGLTSTRDSSSKTSFSDSADMAAMFKAIQSVFPSGTPSFLNLGSVASAFGSQEVTTTDGTTANNATTVTTTDTSGDVVSATNHMGPGRGDEVTYYVNAHVAWAMLDNQVKLEMIDADAVRTSTAADLVSDRAALLANPSLKVGPETGLDLASLKTVIALDPFIDGGPTAPLPASRFRFVEERALDGGGVVSGTFSHTVTATDGSVSTTYDTTVTDDHAGILGALGLGVTQDGSTTLAITESTSTARTTGSTVTASYTFSSQPNESYAIDVYYDVLFGSIAFRLPG